MGHQKYTFSVQEKGEASISISLLAAFSLDESIAK
jgi:hypothetical protein